MQTRACSTGATIGNPWPINLSGEINLAPTRSFARIATPFHSFELLGVAVL